MDVIAVDNISGRTMGGIEPKPSAHALTFSIGLFSEYQNRMSSFLLCRKHPLRAGPLELFESSAAKVLSGRESLLIGPTAFLIFILIQELESVKAAPVLNSININQLLNRHQSAGLPLVKRVLELGVEHGLLAITPVRKKSPAAYLSKQSLRQILQDCSRDQLSAVGMRKAHSIERVHDAMNESDALGVQIKRAYLAHKNGQNDYVLETTAMALKALRGREASAHQRVLDQKVLLLSLRARALLQRGQANASDACLHAVIKCLAISAKRHPLPS